MTNIEVVKLKFELAQKQHAAVIETRDQLQARVDAESDQSIKDILVLGVLQMNTYIAEMEVQLSEVEEMLAEYDRRVANLNQ